MGHSLLQRFTKVLLKQISLIANYYSETGYRYSDDWFRKAIAKRDFANRPYLEIARYSNYIKLKKLVRIIDKVQSFVYANELTQGEVNILDVGTGASAMPALCLARCGYNVTSIDINEDFIARAKSNSGSLHNVRFIVADAEEFLETSDRNFEVILALDTLEHMQRPEEFCHTVFKRLSSPGIFLAIIPDGFSEVELFYTPLAHFLYEHVLKKEYSIGATHIQRFSLRRIKKMLINCDFEYEFLSGIFTTRVPFLLAFLFRFRGLPAFLNIKAADILPSFMTNSWLVCGMKR